MKAKIAKAKPIEWSLADVWNKVAFKPQRPVTKRDYIYASEIGMPFYDRWLKMKGVAYTNPPNERSLRKFLAGNIMEYVVKQILLAAGVYRRDEVKIDAQPYGDCLAVHGRCDFIAGGVIDPDVAAGRLQALMLPEFLMDISTKLVGNLAAMPLREKILELKSVSSLAMDRVEGMEEAIPHHTLQAYHYQKNGKLKADICYLCKDDMRMRQFFISAKASEPLYRDDLLQMTDYYKAKKKPPLAPLMSFDWTFGNFVKNLQVEYSPYLSHYGFNTPDDYRASVGYLKRWNHALNRYVLAETGAVTATGRAINITANNIEVRAEIVKAGYDFKRLLEYKINLGATSEEE